MDNENILYDETKKGLETEDYGCPNCGGKMTFNPEKQTLSCLYCNTIVNVEEGQKVEEKEIKDLLENAKVWNEAEIIKCENCGAKEVVSKGEISTHCPFCGTTNIVKTSEIVGMQPHGICPFEKTVDEASEYVKKWARKKFFAPRSFKKSAKAKALKGVYTPTFSFDCQTETKYSGMLSETTHYRGLDGKMKSRTRTFPIAGKFPRLFDDLLVQAGANVPGMVLSELEPNK